MEPVKQLERASELVESAMTALKEDGVDAHTWAEAMIYLGTIAEQIDVEITLTPWEFMETPHKNGADKNGAHKNGAHKNGKSGNGRRGRTPTFSDREIQDYIREYRADGVTNSDLLGAFRIDKGTVSTKRFMDLAKRTRRARVAA